MTQYQHGGDLYGREHLIDFSENVNPLGLPLSVQEVLCKSVNTFTFYPDPLCRELTAALSSHLGIAREDILFGNGAADLIYRVALAVRPKAGLILAPTFGEYACALKAAGADVLYHSLRKKDMFTLTRTILEKITPEIEMVMLCNPNNPTGQLTPRSLILQIAEKCEELNIPLLVDECFMPFVEDSGAFSVLHSLGKYPNILLLGAFTKLYAMAGLRLGYLVCVDSVMREKIACLSPPWNISTPAQLAGVTSLSDTEYLAKSLELIRRERERLINALLHFKMQVYGSKADYIFFHCPYHDFAQRMEAQGFYVRSCDNYEGLEDGYFRIGIKTYEKNNMLLIAMRNIVEGND